MENPFSNSPGTPSGTPFFKNRKIVLTLVLVVLLLAYGIWAHYGFSLEFFRFFASEPPSVALTASPGSGEAPLTSTLSWTTSDVRPGSCFGYSAPNHPGWNGGQKPDNGSDEVTVDEDTEFTVQCRGGEDDAIVEATIFLNVTVGTPTPTPTGDPESPTPTPNQISCIDGLLVLDAVAIGGGAASARVRNNATESCVVSLAAYEIWQNRGGTPPHYISQQTLFDSQTVTINPGQTRPLAATVPSCYTQVDLVIGNPLVPPNYNGGNLLGFAFTGPPYCDAAPTGTPTPTPTPTGSANPGTPTPSPTTTRTPTPSPTLTNTPTPTPTLTITPTPTATISTTPTPSQSDSALIQKFGRNVTRAETAESSSVTAYPNDTIEFTIRVRALSSGGLSNAVVSDTLPSHITYVLNSTTVDGVSVADGIIGTGISIGSLTANQQKTIRFRGKVAGATALPVGTISVVNVARLLNPAIIAQLPINIINGGDVTQVPTGAEESVFTALLISLMITLMYVAYTRTELFKTHEIKSMIDKRKDREDSFDFKNKK